MSGIVKYEDHPPSPMMDLIANAVNGGADIDVVRELLTMKREVEADEARKAFDVAIASVRKDERFGPVQKNREGHNGRKYADFEAYASMLDPIISDYGVSYRFESAQPDGLVEVTCIVSHEAGHSVRNSLRAGDDKSGSKNAIQAVGSTLTYLQRYTLIQAFGLAATEDDDGQVSGDVVKRVSAAEAKRQGIWDEFLADLADIGSSVGLDRAKQTWRAKLERGEIPRGWKDSMADEFSRVEAEIAKMNEMEAALSVG